MTPEDAALFEHVKALYNSDHREEAYRRFRELYNNNPRDTSLLCWIGYSTPDLDEATQALATVEQLNPYHPSLSKLRKRVSKLQRQQITDASPAERRKLKCPQCGKQGGLYAIKKVSTFGWFVAGMLLFVFFPAFGVGLLFKDEMYSCARYGMVLGNTFPF